jgi:hypothetical protein
MWTDLNELDVLQGICKFVAKINEDNVPSLELFTKKLGFVEVSRSTIFKQITLELVVGCKRDELSSYDASYGSYEQLLQSLAIKN